MRPRAVGVGNVFSRTVKNACVWNGGWEYTGPFDSTLDGTLGDSTCESAESIVGVAVGDGSGGGCDFDEDGESDNECGS